MSNVWLGLAIGAVVGGASGQDAGIAGNASKNSDDTKNSGGYQGLITLWGHETWLYIGGIVGFGEIVGPYLTTGPMIGKDMDWAVGAGIHAGQSIGLGLVIPVRQALDSYNKHQDKLAAYLDMGQQYFSVAQNYVTDALMQMPSVMHTADQLIQYLVS